MNILKMHTLLGDLLDETTLRDNEIIPGASMHMVVWSSWNTVLQAVAMNDLEWVRIRRNTISSQLIFGESILITNTIPEALCLPLDYFYTVISMNVFLQLMKLGVTADSNYRTPNIDYTFAFKRKEIYEERGEVALYMAAARGRHQMVDALLEGGDNIL